MSLFAVDEPSQETAAVQTPVRDLAACTERLAALRFLIIAAAPREQMGSEIAALRRQYSSLIDEIAMNFSVQAAMDAKEEVERTVSAPRSGRS